MKKVLFFILIISSISTDVLAQTKLPSAQSIVADACKEAGKQNKKAFIIFHASWCGWCHKMDSSMNDISCKKFFDKNYVVKHITVYEQKDKAYLNNLGAEDMLKKYHAENQGIPAWYIFDKNGKLLADSQIRPDGASFDTEGKGVGCPANKEEVQYFIKVLKQTAPLSDEMANAIIVRFSKNDMAQ
jgi:thiol-disulfide isomerase/thioredoxin